MQESIKHNRTRQTKKKETVNTKAKAKVVLTFSCFVNDFIIDTKESSPLKALVMVKRIKNLLPLDEMSCAFETERQNEK